MPSFINLLLVRVARGRIIVYYREFLNHLHYFNIYLLLHWCCSLSTDVWVLTHRKGTCRVLLHVSAAWIWRQHHDSDQCAAVFIISFVSTVLLSLRHVADIVSWLLHVLTHADVRPNLQFCFLNPWPPPSVCLSVRYATNRNSEAFCFVEVCPHISLYIVSLWGCEIIIDTKKRKLNWRKTRCLLGNTHGVVTNLSYPSLWQCCAIMTGRLETQHLQSKSTFTAWLTIRTSACINQIINVSVRP
jgi:hypothetical protein